MKVLIVEMKAEIAEAQRLNAEGILPRQEEGKKRTKKSRKSE